MYMQGRKQTGYFKFTVLIDCQSNTNVPLPQDRALALSHRQNRRNYHHADTVQSKDVKTKLCPFNLKWRQKH